MQNFHPWIWPLGFHGSIFHRASSHAAPCRAWGLIPVLISLLLPELHGLCKSHLSCLAMRRAKKQSCPCSGRAVWEPSSDARSGCRWTTGNGEGGLMSWELPREHENMFPYPRKDLWDWDQRRSPSRLEGWSTSPKAKRIGIVQARKGFRVT